MKKILAIIAGIAIFVSLALSTTAIIKSNATVAVETFESYESESSDLKIRIIQLENELAITNAKLDKITALQELDSRTIEEILNFLIK